MSLYSHAFELLPRPDRSVFSSGDEATRARLPDFENVAQLSQFTHRLIVWQMDVPSTFTQAKVGASFICILILVVCLIMARRLYERSFWILRVIKRPSGNILVPNSILAFSFVEGSFCIIFVAFLWMTCVFFQDQSKSPDNYMLWILLPWCLLCFGAIWAGWGTYFAKPNALQSSIDGETGSWFQRIIAQPHVVNTVGLFLPVGLTITILIPALISNVYWQQAIGMEREWQQQFSSQTVFSQEMVQASQQVWYKVLQASRVAAITYVLWCIHAFWIGLAFLAISWALISTIRRELNKAKTLTSFPLSKSTKRNANGVRLSSIEDGEFGLGEQPNMTETRGNHLFSQAEMESNEVCNSFFPPVRPHQIVGAQNGAPSSGQPGQGKPNDRNIPASQSAKPAKSQRSYLRSALMHIYIQLCAVTPACMTFAGAALLLCLTIHGKLEQPSSTGGNKFERYIAIAVIYVTWTTCVFGGITLVAIAHRTYEPVLTTSILTHHRATSEQAGDVPMPKPKKRGAQTNSSFFETHSRVNKNGHPTATMRGGNMALDQVDEGIELPDVERPHVTVERTVETFAEHKGSSNMDESASFSEPEDDFFKGGAGRRPRK